MDKFDIPVNDQNILNDETKSGLEELRDSGVDKINFTKFIEEVFNVKGAVQSSDKIPAAESSNDLPNLADCTASLIKKVKFYIF